MIIGITASSFDLLHAGHIEMLEESKKNCDYLICCLQTDPTIDRPHKNKPIQSIVERYIQLKAVKFVDEIIPYESEDDLIDILKIKMPHIRFLGEEYRTKDFTGKDLSMNFFYNKRQHRFSTSELRHRISKNHG